MAASRVEIARQRLAAQPGWNTPEPQPEDEKPGTRRQARHACCSKRVLEIVAKRQCQIAMLYLQVQA
jgi:hypothetical protein